jgi:hypothetical protein
LTLKQLVASLAPSIDVSISVFEGGAKSIVVDANDWLNISDARLMARLDPLEKMKAQMASKGKNRNDDIRPIFDKDGKPLGRARIRPRFSYYPDGGWVTIGGLRSSRLSNVQGLLVGETLTASRNSAIPLLDKEILKEWASEQARIIAKTNTDDQLKAKCAEVVLECGGDIGDLPVACMGCAEWVNSKRLRQLLLDWDEFIVSFDGEFTYDEDSDDVLPRDFRSFFEVNPNVCVVSKHDGAILAAGSQSWPRSLTGKVLGWRATHLSIEVRRILSEVWEAEFEESTQDIEVGEVSGNPISREVSVFKRNRSIS